MPLCLSSCGDGSTVESYQRRAVRTKNQNPKRSEGERRRVSILFSLGSFSYKNIFISPKNFFAKYELPLSTNCTWGFLYFCWNIKLAYSIKPSCVSAGWAFIIVALCTVHHGCCVGIVTAWWRYQQSSGGGGGGGGGAMQGSVHCACADNLCANSPK